MIITFCVFDKSYNHIFLLTGYRLLIAGGSFRFHATGKYSSIITAKNVIYIANTALIYA